MEMVRLTEEQREYYLHHRGNLCPCCHSSNITSGHLDADGDYAWSRVVCLSCGADWRDVYQLIDIEDIDE